jgi:hypothetical protein
MSGHAGQGVLQALREVLVIMSGPGGEEAEEAGNHSKSRSAASLVGIHTNDHVRLDKQLHRRTRADVGRYMLQLESRASGTA